MKNNLFKIMVATILLVALMGCGNKNSASNENVKQENTESENTENTVENVEDVGEGSFYLENESGTTENGDPIVIYEDGTTQVMQIGITTNNFNGGKLTFIYVDGELLSKEQFGDSTSSIDLTQKELGDGLHQVVLKQFENDDENTDPILVKSAIYEVKSK